jgi:SchA/CurD like domain-containing protein
MSEYWALLWKVKPGSEETVIKLFEEYGRPDHVVRDEEGNEKGLLVSTMVFMQGNTVVRVMEIEGASFPEVAAHMGKQPAIRELEEKLDEYLLEPRDMSTPEGAREFFMKSMMRPLAIRRHDD